MKIWCDSCNKTEASIFCSADEAALCNVCDLRVHQANKLASKHQRFSLLQPSSTNPPKCDICQEKKAFLFCQQDRAILCTDCDFSIHTANELTKKHSRFLLTGALISSKTHQFNTKPQSTNSVTVTNDVNISEYLMEMLPGWQVEDLLDSSSDPVGFHKDSVDDDLQFLNTDLSSYGNSGIMVPQAPPLNSGIFGVRNEIEGLKGDVSKKVPRNMMDDGFTVPQINQQSIGSKRSRLFANW